MRRYRILLIALLCVMLCGCRPESQPPANSEGVEAQTLPPVQVDRPEYTLTYSGELKEQILVQEQEDGLLFSVILSRQTLPIFTLRFNVSEGELVTMLENSSGERIPVSFAMELVPEDLSEEDYSLFCTAQEQVNVIIDSLKLK